MDLQAYKELIEQEENHWWFVSRRALTERLLDLKIPKNIDILDIGCGAGGNLPMLSAYGNVYGCEMNDKVREYSINRKIGTISYGKLPDKIPFTDKQFNLITMFDVLEHVDDDKAALSAVFQKLTDNGKLLVTVPAFQWLFSKHDKFHHHFRRYGKKELKEKLLLAGFEIEYLNYWNFFLFPAAFAARLLDFLRADNSHTIGTKTPSPLINRLLIRLVSAERFLFSKIPFPFGLSLIVVAKKSTSR